MIKNIAAQVSRLGGRQFGLQIPMLALFVSLLISGCGMGEGSDPAPSGGGSSSSSDSSGSANPTGASDSSGSSSSTPPSGVSATPTGNYWQRADGQQMTGLSLVGSTARACANGKEQMGTFKSSYPQSMTYVIEGEKLVFPLQFKANSLVVGVPNQSVQNYDSAPYKKASTYSCKSSDGTSTAPNDLGSVVFWSNLKETGYTITVTLKAKGQIADRWLSSFQPSSPGCVPNTGSPVYTLPPGTYSWSAEGYRWTAYGPTPATWGGSVTITSNGCVEQELK